MTHILRGARCRFNSRQNEEEATAEQPVHFFYDETLLCVVRPYISTYCLFSPMLSALYSRIYILYRSARAKFYTFTSRAYLTRSYIIRFSFCFIFPIRFEAPDARIFRLYIPSDVLRFIFTNFESVPEDVIDFITFK